jgi:hypothetical protein
MTGWLTLAGLIVVALITAYTTDKRLSRQIDAERERQQRDLAAEGERQTAALAHDRELADLADLRKVLDATAATMNAAGEALHLLRRRFGEQGVSLESVHRQRVVGRGRKLKTFGDRLRVRLGRDTAIARRCGEASDALFEMWSVTGNLDDAESIEAVRKALLASEETYDDAVEAFLDAAVERAGTV